MLTTASSPALAVQVNQLAVGEVPGQDQFVTGRAADADIGHVAGLRVGAHVVDAGDDVGPGARVVASQDADGDNGRAGGDAHGVVIVVDGGHICGEM